MGNSNCSKSDRLCNTVASVWTKEVLPGLCEYIRIPCLSPGFDPEWRRNGFLDNAAESIAEWCRKRPVPSLKVDVIRKDALTPLLYIEAPGELDGTVLIYGHLDKQPGMQGWEAGLGPWEPVLRNGLLFGRGGADDGYAPYAAVTALESLAKLAIPYHRVVVLVEATEESGSVDLPAYLDLLGSKIADPDLVVCLDAGCGDYERLWVTSSLRGSIILDLRVDVLDRPVHSGDGGGVVPDSFRILRALLSRLENESTGEIRVGGLNAEIPWERTKDAKSAAEVIRPLRRMPLRQGVQAASEDPTDLLINQTWRPSLTVTAVEGLSPLEQATNAIPAGTTLRLSLRIPPSVDAAVATALLQDLLTADPPCRAHVKVTTHSSVSGWCAPPTAPWLETALERSSQTYFGTAHEFIGSGGTIPFLGMLAERHPQAQYLVTGILGPDSNAHAPNESLEVEAAKRITCCLAEVISDVGR